MSHGKVLHSQRSRWIFGFLFIPIMLGACIWPAVYNGQPFFFTDTLTYLAGADSAIVKLTGYSNTSSWSSRLKPAGAEVTSEDSAPNPNKDSFVAAGRSVYYGALLYLGDAIDHLWPSIILQAAAVLLALGLTFANTIGFHWPSLFVSVVALTLVTPLAFFVSFLMPDIFAGLTILAVANMLVYGRSTNTLTFLIWIGLLSLAFLFHSSHMLIAGFVLAFYISYSLIISTRISWKGIASIGICICIALLGEAAFTLGVTRATGKPPARPPFLMARIIADGPGSAYLKAKCPEVKLTVCRFVDRLPITDSDTFLWSDAAQGGVFEPSDSATRRSLVAEEYRFVWGTVLYDPLGSTIAVIRNTVSQLGSFGLDEFKYSGYEAFFERLLPPPYFEVMKNTKAWAGTLPTRFLSTVSLIVTLASMVFTLFVVLWGIRTREGKCVELGSDSAGSEGALKDFCKIVLVGIFVNAFVCGALSGPHDRYEARVIWLVPVMALLLIMRSRRAKVPAIGGFGDRA